MKVLIVTSILPEKSSTFIRAQIEHLHPDCVLHSGFRPFLYNENKSIFPFPLSLNIVRVFLKRIFPLIYSKLYTAALVKFLVRNKFNVVLCNFGTQASNIAKACKIANVKLVVHFLGYDAYLKTIIKKYRKKYILMFNIGCKFIVVSSDMANQLNLLGCPKEKIVEIPCGFDSKIFPKVNPLDNGKRLLFVGRFTAKKSPELLILAFRHALKYVPDAVLVMIGEGEQFETILKKVHNLHLEKSIILLGFQPRNLVIQEMMKARAYVQHSLTAKSGDSEGSPVSIIEAAGSGLPIISTKHAGIKESVIHEQTGYLVNEGDWQAMGEYMVKLLMDGALAKNMGEEGRNHILKNFEIITQIQKLRNVLLDASEH